MLEKLTIDNYALIDKLSLDFHSGLSIVTGETGAGKSIMLGALSLLEGARFDNRGMVSGNGKKTIVEAEFGNISQAAKKILEEIDADAEDGSVILRREISTTGRARAFVNDTPVNLAKLGEVASRLLDIHSQNSNVTLATPESQLAMLDLYCNNVTALEAYRVNLKKYMSLRKQIMQIKDEARKNRENREFIKFQLEQLDKLNPRRGELREVEKKFDILSDADSIRENLRNAQINLSEGETSVVDRLSDSVNSLLNVDVNLLPGLAESDVIERLQTAIIDIKDISETLVESLEKVEANPARLAKITQRMNELYDANKRFKISREDGLVDLRETLRRQLAAIDGEDGVTSDLEKEAREIAKILKQQAADISERRKQGAEKFEKKLMEKSRLLGLKNLKFKIDIAPCKLNNDGADYVEFICNFNKSGDLQPLSKVASGGEMSRMMLCIKAIMAGKMKLPTVVFDEVDTGVSGDIADKMGAMMQEMSEKIQVISITHLPQVAARGEQHYLVYKSDEGARTISNVRQLDEDERVSEIARMLSGAVIDDAAIANARSLMASAQKHKQ